MPLMREFARRTGVYFGFVEPTQEEIERNYEPTSLARRILGIAVVLVVASILSGLLDGDIWHGFRTGIIVFFMMAAVNVWRDRQARE